jgi:hypothetical protein
MAWFNQTQKNPTLKIPPSKTWCLLHSANATSPRAPHCIANNPRTVQRSTAHCIATSSQHIGQGLYLRMQLQPARCACICACNCNQVAAPVSVHAIATSSPRPTSPRASPAAPAVHHHHTPRTSALHALRSTLRWFRLVRGTNFSKIQFMYIELRIWSSVRSSVGMELGNLALFPGFDSGRKISDFFYFRYFLLHIEKTNSKF